MFWNIFDSTQNNVDSKFVYFVLLIQLFYSCIFCMIHIWSISVAYFLLLSYAYKVYPFFIEVLMPVVIHGSDIILFSLFFTFLIGACFCKVLLMKRKKVTQPSFVSLFSVASDQLVLFWMIVQIFDSFHEIFQDLLCFLLHFSRNWLKMIVMRVTEKFLQVIVFGCKDGRFHDEIGTVPW